MGTNYYLVKRGASLDDGLHIGKLCCGHRFIFHKCSLECDEVQLSTYEEWQAYLKETVIDSRDYIIVDMYLKCVSYERFIELVARQQIEVADTFDGCEDIDGYMFVGGYFS